MITINPYLVFNGNCKEAFDFYKSIFGGEFPYVGKFKDMPANPEFKVSEDELEKIMHISLPISKETVLMGSDSSNSFGQATLNGNNFSISINADTKDETDRLFKALSEKGKVKMPLSTTFWGSYFGMLTDQFGIHWMLSCATENHKNYKQ
jgi:PhnB protein